MLIHVDAGCDMRRHVATLAVSICHELSLSVSVSAIGWDIGCLAPGFDPVWIGLVASFISYIFHILSCCRSASLLRRITSVPFVVFVTFRSCQIYQ